VEVFGEEIESDCVVDLVSENDFEVEKEKAAERYVIR